MGYLTPELTQDGLGMLVAALNGNGLTFTKMVIGNGKPSDLSNVNEVANPVITIELEDYEEHEGYVILTGTYSNSELETGFYMKELGIYAEDDEGGPEQLYAYRYTETEADYIPAGDSGRTVDVEISVIVSIGEAENVNAVLVESDAYAPLEDFNAHLEDYNNPHHVSKLDVGLDLVENKLLKDLTIEFTEAVNFLKIANGDTVGKAYGKIAKLFSVFMTHTSSRNPHGLTINTIGAAAASHTHNAAEIQRGILPIERGGTGVDTLNKLKALIGTGVKSTAYVTASLSSSGWDGAEYSFEAAYPKETYDIEISISPTATADQCRAYAMAIPAGSADSNIITALGNVPVINIPVIIKVMEK